MNGLGVSGDPGNNAPSGDGRYHRECLECPVASSSWQTGNAKAGLVIGPLSWQPIEYDFDTVITDDVVGGEDHAYLEQGEGWMMNWLGLESAFDGEKFGLEITLEANMEFGSTISWGDFRRVFGLPPLEMKRQNTCRMAPPAPRISWHAIAKSLVAILAGRADQRHLRILLGFPTDASDRVAVRRREISNTAVPARARVVPGDIFHGHLLWPDSHRPPGQRGILSGVGPGHGSLAVELHALPRGQGSPRGRQAESYSSAALDLGHRRANIAVLYVLARVAN